MMDYKGYSAKVEFDDSAEIFHGEVLNSAPTSGDRVFHPPKLEENPKMYYTQAASFPVYS